MRRVAATRDEFAKQPYHEHIEAAALVPDAKFGPQCPSWGARHARDCRQDLVDDRFVFDPWDGPDDSLPVEPTVSKS